MPPQYSPSLPGIFRTSSLFEGEGWGWKTKVPKSSSRKSLCSSLVFCKAIHLDYSCWQFQFRSVGPWNHVFTLADLDLQENEWRLVLKSAVIVGMRTHQVISVRPSQLQEKACGIACALLSIIRGFRKRGDHRNRRNCQNRHSCRLFVLHFVGHAKGGQGAFQNRRHRQNDQNRNERYPP